MRNFRKITAIILSLVMLFCVLPINTLATDETYPTITLGQIIGLSFDESNTEYTHVFTPAETGYYSFYSFNNETMDAVLDTCGEIYNSEWEILKADDDGGDGNNFKISVLLNANETYYLKSTTFQEGGIGTCSVTVENAVIADSISLGTANLTCFLNYPDYLPIGIMTEPEDSVPGKVTWTTNDENVVGFSNTDDFHAVIKPIAVGTATVTATTEKGATASCVITVKFPETLTLDTPFTQEFEASGRNVFSFTPSETAVYEIGATYDADTSFGFGYHFDSNSNELNPLDAKYTTDDNNNKQTEQYKLQKDMTYYFETSFYDTGSYTLNITKPAAATEMHLDCTSITGNVGSNHSILRYFGPEGSAHEKTTWSISDESVAQISFESEDYGGKSVDISLLKPGTATLTATSENGLTASCVITVKDYDALTLDTPYTHTFEEIGNKTFTFTPSETGVYEISFVRPLGEYFSYDIYDSDNNSLNYIYSWGQNFEESNTETEYAQFELEKDKKYYIINRSGSYITYTVNMTKPVKATSMQLTQTSINGFVNSSYGIFRHFGPEGCAYEKTTWSISDESIAEISSNPENNRGGNLEIKLLSVGTATITATSESGLTATCTVTVTDPEEIFADTTKNGVLTATESSVTYKFIPQNDGAYNFALNDSQHTDNYLFLELRDCHNNAILTNEGTFFEGQVLLEKAETYYLTVYLPAVDYPEDFEADYFINISQPPKATSITLTCDTDLIYERTDINIFASFYPLNSAIEAVEWSIDNTDAAYISSSNNANASVWIYCHTAGTATITATTTSGLTASYTLNIKSYEEAPVLTLNEKTTVSTKTKEAVFQFTPEESGIYSFYSVGNIYTLCNLLDSNKSYITSDDTSGEGDNFRIDYYLNANETYYITSYLGSNYDDADTYGIWLKKSVPATSVRILNGSSCEDYIYNYIQLYATLNPSNAAFEELIWTVEDESIAFVNGYYDNGGIELYLNNIGTTTVTVSTASGLSDSIEITVKDLSRAEYIKIIDGASITGYVGNNEYLDVEFFPGIREEIFWSSSNPDIASVDEYGNVNFNKEGTATITATSASGLTASCEVTVINIEEIKLNQTKRIRVSAAGESVRLSFTPEESGYYTFYSISSYDTYGWINMYNSDDCGTNKNFRITAYLNAGETYTVFASLYGNVTGEFDVRMERLDVDTSGGDIDFSGDVDALDLAWMRKLIFGIIPLDSASQDIYDINLDGSFDVRDLVRLKTILAKK